MTEPHGTARRERPTFADQAEIDAFVAELRRFERGEIDAEQWRACRVAHGVYSQRQDDFHMLRVKIPQGIASAEQLRALADVAGSYSRGFGHVTTRQDVQFHYVRPEDLGAALRHLARAGLTTSGACGSTVRNVVACPFAGVSPDEAFDVTPYAEAVTRHYLRHPLASSLPRKFKIAFEGCREDHARTAIQDLGFRARVRVEAGGLARGFAVTVAGGTSTACTAGAPLLEFLPAADVLALTESVLRVFHARGDRKHRQRSRLKFLVRELGLDAFRALVGEELARVRREGAPRLPFDPDAQHRDEAPEGVRPSAPEPAAIAACIASELPEESGAPPAVDPDLTQGLRALRAFRTSNVRPQRQEGYSLVTVALPQGDVTAAQLVILGEMALAYGEGMVRFGNTGHAHLRWVRDEDVPALFARLAAAGLGRPGAGSAADVVACPGSDVCELAVARTRDVAWLIGERVRASLGSPALAARLPVHVSGCPHGCSQHHLAAIGLQGSVRKLGARAVPHYFVLVGGAILEGGGARFAKLAGKVPANRAPEAVERLVALWLAERNDGERAADFFAGALDRARTAIADLEELRIDDAREDLVASGAREAFRPGAQEGGRAA